MTHAPSLRAHHLTGSTGRYPRPGWAVAHYLGRGVACHLRRGRRWRQGRSFLSHPVVGWSPEVGGWSVSVFYLSPRLVRRTRRSARLAHLVGQTLPAVDEADEVDPPVVELPALKPGAPPRAVLVDPRPARWAHPGRVVAGLSRLATAADHRQTAAAAGWAVERAVTVASPVVWQWCPLHEPGHGGIHLVRTALRYRLRGRYQRRIKTIVYPLMARLRRLNGVVGVSIRCCGRFTRSQRATHSRYQWGRLGVGDPSQRVASAFVTAALRFGSVGVTVVVNYGYAD